MKNKAYELAEDPAELFNRIKHITLNKYYNHFMNSIEWTGIESEAASYVMKQFWSKGTVAAFNINHADLLGFAPYVINSYGLYDRPEQIRLVNERNISFIPDKNLITNKDVVIGYFQQNHKPVYEIVNYYCDRIAQVDMVINTNLQLQKLPYLVGTTSTDLAKAKNIVKKILNNELAVFTDLDELNMVKVLATNAPYLIDKLYAYKTDLEDELMTYLGIDNAQTNMYNMNVDQTNSNNNVINNSAEGFERTLKQFTDKISEVLGYTITAKSTAKPVVSVHEEVEEDVETE